MPLVNPATGGGSIGATTGTGSVVLENTPTLITPNIGAATGSSLAATGAVTGSNLSGTNTGDQDLSALTSIGLAAGLAIALG